MAQKQKKAPESKEQVQQDKPEVEAKPVAPSTEKASEAVEKALGKVQVIHGIYDSSFDIAGKTVAYAREQLGEMYNIPKDAQALIDGNPVAEDTLLPQDSTLEFIKNAGQKGKSFK